MKSITAGDASYLPHEIDQIVRIFRAIMAYELDPWACWRNSHGVRAPRDPCGRSRWYSTRHPSIVSQASDLLPNPCWFKHSSRNCPWKASTKALSMGLPGLEKSSSIPCWYAIGPDPVTQIQGRGLLKDMLAFRIAPSPAPARPSHHCRDIQCRHPVEGTSWYTYLWQTRL